MTGGVEAFHIVKDAEKASQEGVDLAWTGVDDGPGGRLTIGTIGCLVALQYQET